MTLRPWSTWGGTWGSLACSELPSVKLPSAAEQVPRRSFQIAPRFSKGRTMWHNGLGSQAAWSRVLFVPFSILFIFAARRDMMKPPVE